MLTININMETGVAKAAGAALIKAGGIVPVKLVFATSPGTDPQIELALSAQTSTPAVVAYLDTFEAESELVYLGVLDGSDTRLITLLTGKADGQTLNCEVVVTGDEGRQPFPNFPVTCQQPIITGPETSEGGPVYLKQATIYGAGRVSAQGIEIQDAETGVWRRLFFSNGILSYIEL